MVAPSPQEIILRHLGRGPLMLDHPFDYAAAGFTAADLPLLRQLAGPYPEDLSEVPPGAPDNPNWYTAIHAWYAIQQVGGDEALPALAEALATLREVNDWVTEDLNVLLTGYGAAALPYLAAVIDREVELAEVWTLAAELAIDIALQGDDDRAAGLAVAVHAVERRSDMDPEQLACIVEALLDARPVECADTIEGWLQRNLFSSMLLSHAHVRHAIGRGPEPKGPLRPSLTGRAVGGVGLLGADDHRANPWSSR